MGALAFSCMDIGFFHAKKIKIKHRAKLVLPSNLVEKPILIPTSQTYNSTKFQYNMCENHKKHVHTRFVGFKV
jgi:hypothetical protein